MSKFALDQKIALKVDADGFKDSENINVKLTLLDKDEKELGQKSDKGTIKGEVGSYPFVIKELAKELNIEDTSQIAFVKGWIDVDGDAKIDYDEEILIEVGESCILDIDKFKQIFPNAPEEKRKEVLEVFKKYCHIFEINTPLRVAHFFAQIKEEVGENIDYQTENLNYSIDALKYGDFKYFRNNHSEAELYGRGNGHDANQAAIANRAYGNRADLGNGSIASGDGWNFRGKGFIQLTGRTNYENANAEIQKKAKNSGIDIIKNPESILTINGAMISSMAYWTMNKLNSKADNAGWNRDSVDNITNIVNNSTQSVEDRKKHFDLIKNILNP